MEDAAAEQLSRDEVKRRLVTVCRQLQQLVRGSFGPIGKAQLLQANAQCPDALTITSVAERYFANIDVGDCPIANAYFHMLKSKIRDHEDGGLFLAALSSSLLLEIQEGALAQIPHRTVRKGLQLALDWSLNFLDDPQCPVRAAIDWSSTTSLYAVIRCIVSTKSIIGVNEDDLDIVLLPLILQAFISVFPYVAEFPNERIPVQMLFAPGQQSIAKSEVWKQTVLLDLPWPSRGGSKIGKRSPPLCNLRVALFNITIEPLAQPETEDVNGTSICHTGSQEQFRLEALRQVGDRLEHLGATAVLSQKIIPKYLQAYLAAKNIFTLDRLSLTHIRSVQMLSGATILSNWQIDDSIIGNSLGFLSLVTTQNIGSKQYIRLHRALGEKQPPRSSISHPVTTITVAAPDRFAHDELCHVITTSLKTLARLMDHPQVVAGAGCTEVHIATLLRVRAEGVKHDKQSARTLRQLRQTVDTFANCLESLAGHLCGSHATANGRLEMIELLRNANSASLAAISDGSKSSRNKRELLGWDPRKRSVSATLVYLAQEFEERSSDDDRTIEDARVLDTLQAKRDALVLAVECVSSLIGIASVVRAR